MVEVPIIAFFFVKKEREKAVMMAILVNFISWPIMQSIFFFTDMNLKVFHDRLVVSLIFLALEFIAYKLLLDCSWKKSFMMTTIANTLSFLLCALIIHHFNENNTNLSQIHMPIDFHSILVIKTKF